MIFVIVGSQKFQFNRLLQKLDTLIEAGVITDTVFAQTGESNYQPKHFEHQAFLDRDLFAEKVAQSDLVITHGGTGAIVGAIKKGKKVIAVPRLAMYKEHVDNHQFEIIHQFEGMGMLSACYELEELAEKLTEIKTVEVTPYHSNTAYIMDSIEAFLES